MKNSIGFRYLFIAILFAACKGEADIPEDATTEVVTPVTVTTVETGNITETTTLTATSSYLDKNIVKANANGYIVKVYANVGDHVSQGAPLFSLITKEAQALANYKSKDPQFRVSGSITISAPASGIVIQVDKHPNDYTTDGEQAAIIAEENSFVFLLNVPFELNKYARQGTVCSIILPDSTIIEGTITSPLSTMDQPSQMQSYIVKPKGIMKIPENLVATVKLNKVNKQNTQVVDQAAVLTDETMENYWVMKLINDSTAVKVAVEKGITSGTKTEILSPKFSPGDRIINSGNYGLPDTAYVSIIQE